MPRKSFESKGKLPIAEDPILGAYVRRASQEAGFRSEVIDRQLETVRLWLQGLDLFETALGYLNDANLKPSRDVALILRGELLAVAYDHCRVGLEVSLAGSYPSVKMLIENLLGCWERIAWIRLDPDGALKHRSAILGSIGGSGESRRVKKQCRRAIRDIGTDLDREFLELTRSGMKALRQRSDPVAPAASLNGRAKSTHFRLGPIYSNTEFQHGAKWGLMAIALLLREIQQLRLMNATWRARLTDYESQLSIWLANHPE